ncbi:1920_t:CDS:2, partial [Funneliformis caledonium]
AIDSEFEKVANEALLKTLKISGGSGKDFFEELFPKVDVSAQFTSDFIPILKEQLSNINKNLQIMTLDITSKLATAIGKLFDRHIKILVASIIIILTDKKTIFCDSAIGILNALANAYRLNPLISSFSISLAIDNPLLRKDLLS